MVINLKIVKIIKLQITCCLVFPFLAKNNLFNWSCGSEVVLTSVLTDYSEGIRPVSGQLYRRSFAILARTLHAEEVGQLSRDFLDQ